MFVSDEILYKNLWRYHRFTDWFTTSNNGDKSFHSAKIDNGARGGVGGGAVAVKYQSRYTVQLGNYMADGQQSTGKAYIYASHVWEYLPQV